MYRLSFVLLLVFSLALPASTMAAPVMDHVRGLIGAGSCPGFYNVTVATLSGTSSYQPLDIPVGSCIEVPSSNPAGSDVGFSGATTYDPNDPDFLSSSIGRNLYWIPDTALFNQRVYYRSFSGATAILKTSSSSPTAVPTDVPTDVPTPAPSCIDIPTYDTDGTYWRTIFGTDSTYDGWYLNTSVHPVDVTYNTTGAFYNVSGYNILLDSSVETLYTLSSLTADVGAFICPFAVTEPLPTPTSIQPTATIEPTSTLPPLTDAQIKNAVRDVLSERDGTPVVVAVATPAGTLAPLSTPLPAPTSQANMSTAVALLCEKEPCYSASVVYAGAADLITNVTANSSLNDCHDFTFTVGISMFQLQSTSIANAICQFVSWTDGIRYYVRYFSVALFGFLFFRYMILTVRRVGDV